MVKRLVETGEGTVKVEDISARVISRESVRTQDHKQRIIDIRYGDGVTYDLSKQNEKQIKST